MQECSLLPWLLTLIYMQHHTIADTIPPSSQEYFSKTPADVQILLLYFSCILVLIYFSHFLVIIFAPF